MQVALVLDEVEGEEGQDEDEHENVRADLALAGDEVRGHEESHHEHEGQDDAPEVVDGPSADYEAVG